MSPAEIRREVEAAKEALGRVREGGAYADVDAREVERCLDTLVHEIRQRDENFCGVKWGKRA